MTKIIEANMCDSLGNIVKHGGNYEIINNFSGNDKRELRLIFRLKVKLKSKRTPLECVVKISEFTNKDVVYSDDSNEKFGKYLDNEYLHEIMIYERMSKISDYKKNIMKCYGFGITNDNNFSIMGESFNFSDSKKIMENLPVLGSKTGYIYLVTEYNPNYKIFNKDVALPKNVNKFVVSTLTILMNMYNKYSFCHWDFHYNGNILFNERNSELILFDFDLSTIDTVPTSQYVERVPLYKIFLKYIEEPNYITTKNQLGHYFDIWNFLLALEANNYNLDNISQINVPNYDMPHLISSFKKAMEDVTYILILLDKINTNHKSELTTILNKYRRYKDFEKSLSELLELVALSMGNIKHHYYYDYLVEYLKIGLNGALSYENILTGPNYAFNINCFTALILRNIYLSKKMCLDRDKSECEQMNKALKLNLGIKQCKLVDNICVPEKMKTITKGYKTTYKKRTKKP